MHKDLAQIVSYYATKPHAELAQLLLNKSKDSLIACFNDLLTAYINDKNSSSLREFVTVSIAGYEHNPNKLGYNGYRHDSSIGLGGINCEAKPKNIQTIGYELKKSKSKLNCEGSFNDYTVKRLEKDIANNLNILSSGFVDGQLLYVLEFPFSAIYERLKQELLKIQGPYLRTASFNFSHYKTHEELKTIYCNKVSIQELKQYFNKNLFSFLDV